MQTNHRIIFTHIINRGTDPTGFSTEQIKTMVVQLKLWLFSAHGWTNWNKNKFVSKNVNKI